MKTTLKTAKFTLKTAFARCVAAKILCENGEMYAVFGGFMIDCGMFCHGCGGFYVLFRWLQGLFAVKMQCGNGEIVVRKRQNCGVFAACTCLISCIFVAKVAKWWCDCGGWWCGFGWNSLCYGGCVVRFGRFQPWFPEFHKAFHRSHLHFTANQHLISTFPICQNRHTGTRTGENNVKNRLTHVQKRWKPHSKQQNSHSKQRLRGALRWKFCAKTAKCMRCSAVSWLIAACSVVIAAVSMCFSDDCKAYLRWNAVLKRQNCGVFAACTCLISCISVAKVAKLRCDCGGWLCGCGVFVFGFFMI